MVQQAANCIIEFQLTKEIGQIGLRISRHTEFLDRCKMRDPDNKDIDIDPGTLLAIAFALLLLPLLLAGFFSQ